MSRLLLVIPCRDEAERIAESLEKLEQQTQGLALKVLLADNGSSDDLEAVVTRLQGRFPFSLEYARLSSKPDKGLAIHRAFRSYASGCDLLGYCDADMAAAPEALRRACELIGANKADVVVGDRYHALSTIKGRSLVRALLSRSLSLLWRFLPRSGMGDPGCGLKVMSTASFRSAELPTHHGGFAFGAYLTARLHRMGYRVLAIPVLWQEGGRSRVSTLVAMTHYLGAWLSLLRFWR